MTPLVTPPEVRLVLTREAAKALGCSMRHVRTLAERGAIKSWTLGPKACAYDLDQITSYKKKQDAGRKAGTMRGRPPQGFKADVAPQDRPKLPPR